MTTSNAGEHLIDGEFKSDKFEWCPPGFVPLKLTDKLAQDLLFEYAQRRRVKDAEFSADLEKALSLKGFEPKPATACFEACQRDALVKRVEALAKLVGEAIVCASLAPGESMVKPTEHALIDAVDKLRKERDKAKNIRTIRACSLPALHGPRHGKYCGEALKPRATRK